MRKILAIPLACAIFALSACSENIEENSSDFSTDFSSENSSEIPDENYSEIYEYSETENGIALTGYHGRGGVVKIPAEIDGKKVVETRPPIFCDRSDITAIIFPENLEMVGNFSVQRCENLTRVEFPKTLKFIDNGAFFDCDRLESVVIPEGTLRIGLWAFDDCERLTSVKLPDSLEYIGDCAFRGCPNVKVEYRNVVYTAENVDEICEKYVEDVQ